VANFVVRKGYELQVLVQAIDAPAAELASDSFDFSQTPAEDAYSQT